ncbi:MAG: phytanoyl-CoA dioxygenase family protein, partial [Myxococcota bacterium]
MKSGTWNLTAEERRAYAEDGFFARQRVFRAEEILVLAAAAERAVVQASEAVSDRNAYEIDGNRYCEALGTTIQFEHSNPSRTIRVLEPFHHFDPHFEGLIDDPRLVEPMRGLVGSQRIALFTDKLNLKRPREGSRFRWHQDS